MKSNTRETTRSKGVDVDRSRMHRSRVAAVVGVTAVILTGSFAGCSSTVVDKLAAARRGDPGGHGREGSSSHGAGHELVTIEARTLQRDEQVAVGH